MRRSASPPNVHVPSAAVERRALQIAVAIGSLIPISAGLAGVLLGPEMMASAIGIPNDLDSHFRYLSGLLLAIGIGFVSTIPRIEAHGGRFRLLTAIVVTGGIGRLISMIAIGPGSRAMLAALAMELMVTPGLAVWQHRVARMERDRNEAEGTR
jgi:Domain of unknown function (DUF4345)